MSTLRIEKWDNLKFILIYLVVLGHLCDMYTGNSEMMRSIFFFIYTFHMPLFIFVSGLFCKKTITEKRYYNIFAYVMLYLFIKVITFAAYALFEKEIYFTLLSEGDVPWYALFLAEACLVCIVLNKFDRKYVSVLLLVLGCLVGYDTFNHDFLVIGRLTTFLPFFYLGFIFDEAKVRNVLSKVWVKAGAVLVLGILAVISILYIEDVYWLRVLMTGRNSFALLEHYSAYGGLIKLVYYFVTPVICCAVIALTPEKSPKSVMARLGKRSVQIFALHLPFVILFAKYDLINNVFIYIWPQHPAYLVFVAALIITLICSWKGFGKIFDMVLNPKLRGNDGQK